ncbi:MAG: M42 family metallopeptidase [Chloroflexi bacterium]|nr:M42 family metallopeptidase [Chloroflexota bacterium]MCC6895732.1 M42 family metallopeptidase [Anaerolineae bacterium]
MSDIRINLDETVTFLTGLLDTPSPTGYTVEAIDYVEAAFKKLKVSGLKVERTKKGALIAQLKGKSSSAPRGITAHIDTLGLMVKEIKGSGRLKATLLGGYAWNAVEYEGVTVRTADNKRIRGTMLLSNPSTHVNGKLGTIQREADNMEIRLDAITKNAADTRALGIDIGDFIFLDPRVELKDTNFLRSRHLDDKAGVAAIYGALLALKAAKLQPAQDTTFIIANYEEVGHGGSADWPTELDELLTIDMGALGDGQNGDEFSVSICAKDSTGPYHYAFTARMRELAKANNIPYKMDIYPFYGSDGSAYWRAGGAAKVALIGPGIDASHGYERTHTSSIEHTAHLIAQYLVDSGE